MPQRSLSNASHRQRPSASGSSAADLYSQAMASVHNRGYDQNLPSPPRSTKSAAPVPQYRTAEEEKAALRRYHEAKAAVDRNQGSYAEDVGNTSFYSSPPSRSTSYTAQTSLRSPPRDDRPPDFESASASSSQPLSAHEEKARLRRQYEDQDRVQSRALSPPPVSFPQPQTSRNPPSYASPPPPVGGQAILSAVAEKEMLRRRYENEEAAAAGRSPPPPSHARSPSYAYRNTPQPPSQSLAATSSSRILTAAEEKAMLQAKYDAERREAAPPPLATPPPLPPLMPRPPAEYIEETKEHDARVSTLLSEVDAHGRVPNGDASHSLLLKTPPPPPALPPKVPEDP